MNLEKIDNFVINGKIVAYFRYMSEKFWKHAMKIFIILEMILRKIPHFENKSRRKIPALLIYGKITKYLHKKKKKKKKNL